MLKGPLHTQLDILRGFTQLSLIYFMRPKHIPMYRVLNVQERDRSDREETGAYRGAPAPTRAAPNRGPNQAIELVTSIYHSHLTTNMSRFVRASKYRSVSRESAASIDWIASATQACVRAASQEGIQHREHQGHEQRMGHECHFSFGGE